MDEIDDPQDEYRANESPHEPGTHSDGEYRTNQHASGTLGEKDAEFAFSDESENLVGEPTDQVPKVKAGKYCNAKKQKEGEFAGYCRNPAGFDTDHLGEGRCKYHGGRNATGSRTHTFKHGIFSDYLDEEDQRTIEILREHENADKLQEIIDWRISRLRRGLRAKYEDDEVTTDFWEAFNNLVDSTGSIGAEEIRELGSLAAGQDQAIRAEIDQIRKMIKDHAHITEGEKVNISPSEQWRLSLMKAQQEAEEE